ncbi:MAG: serine/threonine protein kinase [Clostridia bacterium]|nr:serine/threonine protein kinase [Clostridia bacterium]
MFDFGNEYYCEYCFEPMKQNMVHCPRCGSHYNIAEHADCLPVGYILAGKYLIGRALGQGGFGKTYLAYDFRNKTRVAVKEFFPESHVYRTPGETMVRLKQDEATYRKGVQRFYKEACLLARFHDCPQIVRIEKMYNENNTAYFVMEYLTGSDLRNHMQRGMVFNEGQVINLTMELLTGLSILHENGVLHRDIAPDNIFLCADGQVKLIDFGASKITMGQGSNSMAMMVKPGFAPFEQYQTNGDQGPWTDIYALGATLYYLLKRVPPRESVARVRDAELDYSGISPRFATILDKMLAVKAEYRYQSVEELFNDLFRLQQYASYRPAPPMPTPPSAQNLPSVAEKPSVVYNPPVVQEPPHPVANRQSVPPPPRAEKRFPVWIPILLGILLIVGLIGLALLICVGAYLLSL